ncbi:MAG: hypothetical protein JW862_04130 [Anaerolineales bacterium]|nr:hypothetical protein [Anaerolineales bacterium]
MLKFKIFKRYHQNQQAMRALDASLAGELPAENLADDLPALLSTARQLQAVRPDLAPRPGFLAASRQQILAHLQAGAPRPGLVRRQQTWGIQLAFQFILVVMVFFAGAGLALAAEVALPGDSLYPIRNLTEQLRLAWVMDPGRDAALRLQFAQDYLVDSALLLSQERPLDAHQALRAYDRYIVGAGRVLGALSEREQQQLTNLLADLNQTLGQDVVIMEYLPAY